jgi:hypothetical protein
MLNSKLIVLLYYGNSTIEVSKVKDVGEILGSILVVRVTGTEFSNLPAALEVVQATYSEAS